MYRGLELTGSQQDTSAAAGTETKPQFTPPSNFQNHIPGLAGANAYGMDPTSASAFDTGMMLGFEQPAAPMAPTTDPQMSLTDPLIQTL